MKDVKADLRSIYDGEVHLYGDKYDTHAGKYFMLRKINKAIALGVFKKGYHLLEIGCPNGPYTLEFAKLGFSITGLDIYEKCLIEAGRRASELNINNVQFVLSDTERLSSIADNSFDGAISFSSFRYFPNSQQAINELFRVIKKGSNVVIDFPNKSSPWFKYMRSLFCGPNRIYAYDHQYSSRQVTLLLRNAGFENICTKRILFTPNFIGSSMLKVMKMIDLIFEPTPLRVCYKISVAT